MQRFVLISALLLGGCGASRQYFQPTERVRGTTLQGYPEAIYELVGPSGQFGEAKVWSRGAYRGPNKTTVVHASIEIHNTSAAPIQLRSADVRLDPVRTDDGVLTEIKPAEARDYEIPPGAIRELRFHFVLPAGTSPGEVSAFRLRWSVTSAGRSYSQHTPFVEEYRRYGYYGYGPPYPYHYFCDPFDPFCFYRGPYYYPYGVGAGYGVVIERPATPPRVIVHPRR